MSHMSGLRQAFRQLRNNPGFTCTVLITLALCIGANTAVYSVIDAVLLRPVPYPEPDRLAMVVTAWRTNGHDGIYEGQSGYLFESVRDGTPGLQVAAAGGGSGANFAGDGAVEYIAQNRVSTGYFRVLGITPQYGREFNAVEDKAGGPAVAVISHAFWQRAFHGDPNVLGRGINLRGQPHTVIGIMPRGFVSDSPTDVWTPLRPSRTGEGNGSNYEVFARLRPGVSWAAASDQLKALKLDDPNNFSKDTRIEQRIVPLRNGLTGGIRTELLLTWSAVLIVLLIGCVNIAGLLLARGASRRREIATRLALGCGRAAIVRQLLAESFVLAILGGGLGVLAGQFGLEALKRLGAQDFELWHPLTVDLRVLAGMLVTAILTSLLFGLVPALEASRVDIRAVLIEGGRGASSGGRRWLRAGLVVGEVALSLVLLVSAGLLVRSLVYLDGLNPGFDTRHVLTAQTSLDDARYRTRGQVNLLFTKGLDRIRQIPGVESAGAALTLPFQRPLNNGMKPLDGMVDQRRTVETVYVTPGYFETLRIPVLAGRSLREADKADSRPVVVVSQSLAKKYFKNGDALGHHVQFSKEAAEIVGIAGDVQQHSGMGNFGPISINPTLYVPVSQTSDAFLQLVHTWFTPRWAVRASSSSGNLPLEIQRAIASVDPQLPVSKFLTIDQLRSDITRQQRYHAALFASMAALAVLLAAVGLYGLISHSVSQRTREIGIRMALGASMNDAMVSIMRPGLVLSIFGVAIGITASLGVVKLLRTMIWGVQPVDPLTFAGTALLLIAIGVVSTLLPALRLLRLDPAVTLRDE